MIANENDIFNWQEGCIWKNGPDAATQHMLEKELDELFHTKAVVYLSDVQAIVDRYYGHDYLFSGVDFANLAKEM